jgi:tRNA(Ile)-lysidine synthase TilS/MesJ
MPVAQSLPPVGMKAHYINDSKDLRVIRPMAYVRERQLADFAKSADLPVILDSCPACFSDRYHTQFKLHR